MKKIIIILSLLAGFNSAHGMTVNQIVDAGKVAQQQDKQIKAPSLD